MLKLKCNSISLFLFKKYSNVDNSNTNECILKFVYRKKLISACVQGYMYKNRVENNRFFFEIPALLYCKRENLAENGAGKFTIYMLF